MADTLERPVESITDTDGEQCHLVCSRCYGPAYTTIPLLAICGYDCSDSPQLDDSVEMPSCLECSYLDRCSICGLRAR